MTALWVLGSKTSPDICEHDYEHGSVFATDIRIDRIYVTLVNTDEIIVFHLYHP